MLLDLLRSVWHSVHGGDAPAADEYPVMRQMRAKRAHERAPLDAHREILFRDVRIGEHRLTDLVAQCLSDSNSVVPPAKALHRPLASFLLARYYLYALGIEGARAECGVFQGASALLLCRAARTKDAAHTGEGLHLIDSFAGLSEPVEVDSFSIPRSGGSAQRQRLPQGTFTATFEQARLSMKDFPGVAMHRGWIPEVFAQLPEGRWSFVHIDVDLYEPTYASLEYFYPRLSHGGVMICDDYGAPLFPGAYRAWNRFCDERQLPFAVLDTGQSVILKR